MKLSWVHLRLRDLQLLAKNAGERLGSGQSAERDIKSHAFYRRVDWDKIENRDVQPPFKPRTVYSYFSHFIIIYCFIDITNNAVQRRWNWTLDCAK